MTTLFCAHRIWLRSGLSGTPSLGLRFLACAAALLMPEVAKLSAQSSQIQTLTLDQDWSLMVPQVLPDDRSPATVFSTLGNDFTAVWTIDHITQKWSTYARPGTPEDAHNRIAPLDSLQEGQPYWVYMTAPRTLQIEGVPPSPVPPVNLPQGWNFFGVPIGAAQLPETVNLQAVLTAAGFDYDVLLGWEAGLYRKLTNDAVLDPNKGYVIHTRNTNFNLQPKLVHTLRADVNVEPTNNYNASIPPGPEDLKLSDSPTPLDSSSQTHIVFLPGEDSQTLALGNTGGGILLWTLEWTATTATNVPWLTLNATQGVTTIENDIISLHLDRKNLVQGTYGGTLTLRTTATNAPIKTFMVVAHVPSIGGEWHGSATVTSVNGRRNPVPDIDLFLSFYEDPSVPGLMRGYMDSRNAVLWPVDVPLIGHIQSSAGNRLSLSGGYVLPPGNQNNPPYDQFRPLVEDVDWTDSGKPEDVNPYPFPIYRSVTLLGELSTASREDGYTLTGNYLEMI